MKNKRIGKRKRSLLSFLLVIVITVGLLPKMNMVVFAEPSGTGISTLPTTAGTYYLTQDITINSTWYVPGGTTTLDLNGHGIRMTGSGSVIRASNTSSILTLIDSNPDSIHYITLNNYRGTAVSDTGTESDITNGTGTIKVMGGYITGGYDTNRSASTSNINAGGITFCNGGVLTITGGTIIGNVGPVGGGINVGCSDATISGNTKIIYNRGDGRICAGIANASIYNTANTGLSNTVTITDNVQISNNYSPTWVGALYMQSGTFDISGNVEIIGNKAAGYGAICVQGGNLRLSGNPKIYGNTTTSEGNSDVCLNGGDSKRILINGRLGSDARIGVYIKGGTVGRTFTSGLKDTGDGSVSSFFNNNSGYKVIWDNDEKEAMLAKEYTVTFKVENGSWNDETKEDKSVSVIGNDSDTLRLKADQIPSVGNRPDNTYIEGEWDVTPSTDTVITGNTTYTYTYAQRKSAVVTTAPSANNRTYDKTEQPLLKNDGVTVGGTLYYALGSNDTDEPADSEYSTLIPTKTNAGTYYVWYKAVKINDNYTDSVPVCVPVTISQKPVTVSGITAENKIYDGTDTATLDYSDIDWITCGMVDGDNLDVSATGTFSDSNVAVNTSGEAVAKTVNITDLTLGGEDVDNYILADTGNQSETTAIISKKAATITAKNQTVPLAGNITDSVMMADLSGALNGHELTAIILTPSSTANATTSGTITPSTATIKNGSKDVTANYDITYINGVLTVEKAATDVTTPPSPKVDIVYNGELQALVTPGEGVTGGKIVYAVTLTDDEPDSSEYSEEIPKTDKTGTYYVWYKVVGDGDHNDSDVSHFTVVIDKKEITVSGITALDKTYDTTDEVTLNLDNVVFNGIEEGDKLTVTATGSFEDEKAGEDKNVDINVISLGGADADNYRLAQDGQQTNTTATINKKKATITALDQKIVIDSSIDTSLEMAVLDGAIEGHELAEIILKSGNTASTTAEGVITPSEAKIVSGDTDVTDNYDITYVNGVMTVTKADSEVILDKTSVGEDTSVTTVESPNLQEFAEKVAEDGKLVKVELSVKPVTEAELEADTVSGIMEAADTVFANVNKTTLKLEYLEIDITKYVDGLKQGAISDTTTPIEIVVTYDTSKAGNPVIIRRHGDAVSVFTLLSSKPSGDYKDATYYIDGNKIYIYSQYFSDFAIVYSAEKKFNVNLDNGMGGITRIIVSEGAKYTPPADFIRDGYDFGGWYKDETFTQKWNPDTDIVTADTKLFAQWIKKADTITPTDDTTSETKVDKPEDTDNKQTDAKKTIDTGDHSQVPIAFMLMLDSAMAMIYLTLRRKMIK